MTEKNPKETLLVIPSVLKDRYQIVKKLGGGGFGEIYEGRIIDTGQPCAIKVESNLTPKQVLKMEAAVLRKLQALECPYSCQFLGAGKTDKVNYVVMTLLGSNLSELRKKQPEGRFTWSTTFRLAVQMLKGIQAVHECGFLHRDIKPSNFAMGSQSSTRHVCYILDFGLARQYITATGETRDPRPIAGFRGTVRYASINAHRSIEMGRHDDLWSLFYMLMEFLHGQLPWRRLKEKEDVAKEKEAFDHREFLIGLPDEFEDMLNHLEGLDYYAAPDYLLVEGIFTSLVQKYRFSDSDPMDWETDLTGSMPSTSGVSHLAFRNGPSLERIAEADGEDQPHKRDHPVEQGTKTHCSAPENFSGGEDNYPLQVDCVKDDPLMKVVEVSREGSSRDKPLGGVPVGVVSSEGEEVPGDRKISVDSEVGGDEEVDGPGEDGDGEVVKEADGRDDEPVVTYEDEKEVECFGDGENMVEYKVEFDSEAGSGEKVDGCEGVRGVHSVGDGDSGDEVIVNPNLVVSNREEVRGGSSSGESVSSRGSHDVQHLSVTDSKGSGGGHSPIQVHPIVEGDTNSKPDNNAFSSHCLEKERVLSKCEDVGIQSSEGYQHVVASGEPQYDRSGDEGLIPHPGGVNSKSVSIASSEKKDVDSLHVRLLQLLGENESSQVGTFLTDTQPNLPMDYERLLRSQPTLTSVAALERQATLHNLQESKVLQFDRSREYSKDSDGVDPDNQDLVVSIDVTSSHHTPDGPPDKETSVLPGYHKDPSLDNAEHHPTPSREDVSRDPVTEDVTVENSGDDWSLDFVEALGDELVASGDIERELSEPLSVIDEDFEQESTESLNFVNVQLPIEDIPVIKSVPEEAVPENNSTDNFPDVKEVIPTKKISVEETVQASKSLPLLPDYRGGHPVIASGPVRRTSTSSLLLSTVAVWKLLGITDCDPYGPLPSPRPPTGTRETVTDSRLRRFKTIIVKSDHH